MRREYAADELRVFEFFLIASGQDE